MALQSVCFIDNACAHVADHKEDRARIRVEHIIREDFLVEAYELLEMYCDLLLARFGLIQQIKHISCRQLDDGIAEAVISILWAAPRVATDVSEFKVISDQLTMKYGKAFAEAARCNQLEYPAKVSPKLIAKLSVQAPPKLLVERYMIEISKSAGIPFTPDANVMREDEVAAAEQMLIDFKNQGGQGYGWMYPGDSNNANKKGPPASPPPPDEGTGYYPGPPPPPPAGFKGGFGGSGGGGGGGGGLPAQPSSEPGDFIGDPSSDIKLNRNASPGVPSAPPTDAPPFSPKTDLEDAQFPVPPNNDFPDTFDAAPYPTSQKRDEHPSDHKDELDFDDLAKRFDMLKKKGPN
ncbi:unnamed protein product [Gongylonema pulchrum]|uniref:IST1 homolog n=1 Tax=Gongylonema pulchrum TaxID=637853 RepID=A0A183D1Z1_9BILA|nr:unnamed protein product [Gongylonema pulchrum]